MLIDTHCHLTSDALQQGVSGGTAAVLARAVAAGVGRVVTVGTDFPDHGKVLALLRDHASVFGALGIHPHYAAQVEEGYEAFLENRVKKEPKVLALGECGLDYHYDYSPKLLQRGVFLNQLEMARRVGLPVILHVREAHADALAIMEDFTDLRFVVHCFTGTPAECAAWVELGAYIGFTGIVTYGGAGDVQAAAKLTPADRLLVETDSPYLSPEPVRKVKPNEPAHVAHTAAFVAQLRGVSAESLAEQTTTNAGAFYGERLLLPI